MISWAFSVKTGVSWLLFSCLRSVLKRSPGLDSLPEMHQFPHVQKVPTQTTASSSEDTAFHDVHTV